VRLYGDAIEVNLYLREYGLEPYMKKSVKIITSLFSPSTVKKLKISENVGE
jgi:hypothetical protein